jgi:hypothetical protein
MPSPFDIVFQKGGFFKSLSREETVARLNPLSEQLTRLTHAYETAAQRLAATGDPKLTELARRIKADQRFARMDIGKVNETTFSNGGTAYNGTGIEPGQIPLPSDPGHMAEELERREGAHRDDLKESLKLDHQIRTQAILGNLLAHSEQRLTTLGELRRAVL